MPSRRGVDALPRAPRSAPASTSPRGDIAKAVAEGHTTLAAIKQHTKAGTGCGGCVPLISQVLNAELEPAGHRGHQPPLRPLPHSRQNCSIWSRWRGSRASTNCWPNMAKAMAARCANPTVGSILASCWNEHVLSPLNTQLGHQRHLPSATCRRTAATPSSRAYGRWRRPRRLLAVAEVARDYKLYTKITRRPAHPGLFGARSDDPPAIWRKLLAAGFETGRAYAKALRMAKTCVGSTWCRFGAGTASASGSSSRTATRAFAP